MISEVFVNFDVSLLIPDVFLIRSILTSIGKLAIKGVVSLKGIGSTILKELSPNEGIGSGTKLITKLKRFFVQDLRSCMPNSSVIFRVLKEHFKITTEKGLQRMFEMHHWLIQHSWYEGKNAIRNPFVRHMLQRLGMRTGISYPFRAQ